MRLTNSASRGDDLSRVFEKPLAEKTGFAANSQQSKVYSEDACRVSRLMLEHRREIRTTTNRRGAIKFGATGQEMPCTIIDLTVHGAGLSLGTAFGVPRVFQLAIDGEKNNRHCRVVWTDGRRLGVSFE